MNASPTAAASVSRAPGLTPAQLRALAPHVVVLTDGRLDREAVPEPRTEDDVATVEDDLDAIFDEHLPAFMKARGLTTVPIVLYAHGGLVSAQAGLATAQTQVEWWKAHGVYPIHFVWKTGALSSIWDAIGRFVSGGSRGFFDDAKDRLIEEGARLLGGEHVWRDMKLDAAASSDPAGCARMFVRKLAAWMDAHPDTATIHAVGHSAGSIFHAHLVPAALDAGVPRIETLTLLAPAVRMDTFRRLLLPRADRIGRIAVFTMTEQAELDDDCFRVYGRSLLYLVSASFEAQRGTAILGLAKDIDADDAVRALLGSARGDLVLTPNTLSGASASTAASHGTFNDDAATMESVLLRVTGLKKVKAPFPSPARSIDPWDDIALPDSPRGGGGRTALCVGIDAYTRPGDRLKGAVADSRQWGAALTDAGFRVTSVTDADATRANILGTLFQMVTTAQTGDALVFQYAGHGTHAPDLTGAEEDDDQDEAICPVDFREGSLILDDDLAPIWDLLPDGVSLTIFFDSCHSGGANRDVTPGAESLPRGVSLDARDVEAFREARGVRAPRGRTVASAAVAESEESAPPEPPPARPAAREVHFAACTATQLAWETNGSGDFTSAVAPLLAERIGRVTNTEFFALIGETFDAHRQTPTYVPGSYADALLLTAGAAAPPALPSPETRAEASAPTLSRDAAIAAILRGVADLLES